MTIQESKRESSVKSVDVGSKRMERYIQVKKEAMEQLEVALKDNTKFDERLVELLRKTITETEVIHPIEGSSNQVRIKLDEALFKSFMMSDDKNFEDLKNEKRVFLNNLIKHDLIRICSNVMTD